MSKIAFLNTASESSIVSSGKNKSDKKNIKTTLPAVCLVFCFANNHAAFNLFKKKV